MLNGPGKYSLDRALGIRLPGWVAPLGLLGVLISVYYADLGAPSASEEDEASEELSGEED